MTGQDSSKGRGREKLAKAPGAKGAVPVDPRKGAPLPTAEMLGEAFSDCVIPRSETALWKEHLEKYGCVGVRGVLSADDVAAAKDKYWRYLEALGSGVKRGDVDTWRNANWPGDLKSGFDFTGAQTECCWWLRCHPAVAEVFAEVWGTEELLASMDTMVVFRPWWRSGPHEDWKPAPSQVHVDQNPHTRPGRHCVQGMLPLLPVTPDSGGLQLVPWTHTDTFQEWLRTRRFPHDKKIDFLQFSKKDELVQRQLARLVEAMPGDMILWDSRTVHGGVVGEPSAATVADTSAAELARLSMCVCMTPRAWAAPEALEGRREAFLQNRNTTHWPHECATHYKRDTDGSNIPPREYKPAALTEEQLKLLY